MLPGTTTITTGQHVPGEHFAGSWDFGFLVLQLGGFCPLDSLQGNHLLQVQQQWFFSDLDSWASHFLGLDCGKQTAWTCLMPVHSLGQNNFWKNNHFALDPHKLTDCRGVNSSNQEFVVVLIGALGSCSSQGLDFSRSP